MMNVVPTNGTQASQPGLLQAPSESLIQEGWLTGTAGDHADMNSAHLDLLKDFRLVPQGCGMVNLNLISPTRPFFHQFLKFPGHNILCRSGRAIA